MRVYGRKREFPLRRPHELRWQISIKMEGWTLPRRAITLLATSLQITLRFWCSIIASARRVGTWYVLHSLGYRHLAGRGSECKHVRLAIAPACWTNDDLPTVGENSSFEQWVSEMTFTGYQGCSVGHKFPRDSDVLELSS